MRSRRYFLGIMLAGAGTMPALAAPRRAAPPERASRATLPLVVLDPGHGGADPGAVGQAGTLEKRVVLAVAQELRRRLEAGGRVRVALTRSRDVFVPLAERVAIARRQEAALFLSIHADSAPPGHGAQGRDAPRGASIYTLAETASDPFSAALARRENQADQAGGLRLPSVPPDVQRILLSLMRAETRQSSERLARQTMQAMAGDLPLLSNPHRRAGFVVLKAPDVPSALVEIGFLSHPGDEALLNRPAWRARVADSLADGVHAFVGRRVAT